MSLPWRLCDWNSSNKYLQILGFEQLGAEVRLEVRQFCIAAFKPDLGAQLFESSKMKIYWTGSNRTAARQRNLRLAKARQQRTERQHGCSHSLYEFVRRFEYLDMGRVYFVRAEFGSQYGGSQVFKQATLRDDVARVRKIVQRYGFRAQQSRRHARQR